MFTQRRLNVRLTAIIRYYPGIFSVILLLIVSIDDDKIIMIITASKARYMYNYVVTF